MADFTAKFAIATIVVVGSSAWTRHNPRSKTTLNWWVSMPNDEHIERLWERITAWNERRERDPYSRKAR